MAQAKRVAPRGRAAVERALLDAAGELFAARGVGAVSVRDVAEAARVNHGLVHRYFGSKDGLQRAVMADLTRELAREAAVPGALGSRALESPAMRRYFRLLARSLLDGVPMAELQESFPVVALVLREIVRGQAAGTLRDDVDPRSLTALGVATGLGWLLFEPFVVAALGASAGAPADETLRARALAGWLRMVSG